MPRTHYHPTTRVLAVLELLQAHGRISGPEMARRLDVDARTLRRYIAILEEFGIPITAERGRYGGYALVAGFKLPPMMFTDDEALALSVGLLAARSLGLSDAQLGFLSGLSFTLVYTAARFRSPGSRTAGFAPASSAYSLSSGR